jgi:hypothetical protein
MKITMKRSWWLLCLPLGLMCLLSACVDRNYDIDDLDSTIKVDTELVAPLAYSKLKINDLLMDSLSGMQLVVEDEEMYLLYTDSQYMGNELIDQLKVLPKGKSEFQLLAGEDLPGTLITSGEISQDYTIEFSDLNTNPNERLDSILFDDCLVDVIIDVTMPLADDSYFDFIFPEEVLSLDKTRYPDNTMRVPITQAHTEASLSLYKAMLRLNGSNQVKINVRGYIHASEPFQSGDKIDVTLDFDHVMPHLTYMNIGTARDIYEGEKIIDFNYTSDFQQEDAFFPFYDPQIQMSCVNNIGVPVRYYIDYVEAIDTRTGETVRADFGGEITDTTSIVVNTPSYDAIEGLSIDELMNFDLSSIICQSDTVFDREYGHTDRLFKINPNKLKYHYRIRSIDDDPTHVHYFFQKSDMKLKESTKLPLWFEGDPDPDKNFHISRTDSVLLLEEPADIGSLDFTPNTEVVLNLTYKNYLPIGVQGTVQYLDYNDQLIMPEANQTFGIVAAEVGADGYVKESTDKENAIQIAFDYNSARALLTQVRTLLITYRLANDELKTIRLRTSDWLELKANIYFDGAIIYEFN